MKTVKKVSIIGLPNVGKSSLFNRLLKTNRSLVKDFEGITRDPIVELLELKKNYFVELIDTGGIFNKTIQFYDEIFKKTKEIIEVSDLLLLVVDIQKAIDILLYNALNKIKKWNKPIILVVNKVDALSKKNKEKIEEFKYLGFKNIVFISCSTKIGIYELVKEIQKLLVEDQNSDMLIDSQKYITLIGRQNAGKSTFINALFKKELSIVSNVAGTTVDILSFSLNYKDNNYKFCDTPGIKPNKKAYDSLDKFSLLKIKEYIIKSKIVVLIVDAYKKIVKQDLIIASLAKEYNKPLLVVLNKIDLLDHSEIENLKKSLAYDFAFISYAQFVFLSAKTSKNFDKFFQKIALIEKNLNKSVLTGKLNQLLVNLQLFQRPKTNKKNTTLKIFYGIQKSKNPPTFLLFVNKLNVMHFSYRRFLINNIVKEFSLVGVPIILLFKKK